MSSGTTRRSSGRERRRAPSPRGRRRDRPGPARDSVRVSLADPVSYTLPYDRALAGALRGAGNDVDSSAASFLFAELPPPEGYRQHEIFFTAQRPRCCGAGRARGCASSPRGSSTCRTRASCEGDRASSAPDVLHVQWLGLPRYDLRWLEAARRERPVVFTAHDVLPRRTAKKVDLWQAGVRDGRPRGRARRGRRRAARRARRDRAPHRAHPASGVRAARRSTRPPAGRRSSSSASSADRKGSTSSSGPCR